uniref:Uncharacterized protein n=1 Tax=Ciona intestinalis TaxID=7719 RepID=H2XYC2_CIOIN
MRHQIYNSGHGQPRSNMYECKETCYFEHYVTNQLYHCKCKFHLQRDHQ